MILSMKYLHLKIRLYLRPTRMVIEQYLCIDAIEEMSKYHNSRMNRLSEIMPRKVYFE